MSITCKLLSIQKKREESLGSVTFVMQEMHRQMDAGWKADVSHPDCFRVHQLRLYAALVFPFHGTIVSIQLHRDEPIRRRLTTMCSLITNAPANDVHHRGSNAACAPYSYIAQVHAYRWMSERP